MKLEYFMLYFLTIAFMAYTDKLCNARYSIITKIYGVFCLILTVTQSFSFQTSSVIWEYSNVIVIVWICIYNIILPFIRELKKDRKFTDALANTYPGNLLIATLIIGITSIFDLIDSLTLHYSLHLTNYSIVVFALSVTFMLFRMSVIKDRELKEKSLLLEKATSPESAREKTFRLYGLTEREKEVARLMAEGLDNKEIGKRLFLSTRTAAFHVTNIFRKFGIIDGKNKGRAMFLAKLFN
jgi:DNA-binding CsgD family transcriptional regulator